MSKRAPRCDKAAMEVKLEAMANSILSIVVGGRDASDGRARMPAWWRRSGWKIRALALCAAAVLARRRGEAEASVACQAFAGYYILKGLMPDALMTLKGLFVALSRELARFFGETQGRRTASRVIGQGLSDWTGLSHDNATHLAHFAMGKAATDPKSRAAVIFGLFVFFLLGRDSPSPQRA